MGRRTSDIGQSALAVVVVLVFRDFVPGAVALTWLVVFALMAIARGLHRGRLRPTGNDRATLLPVLRFDVWLSAVMWAAWAVLLREAPTLQLALLMIVFAGIIGAATATMVADRPSFLGFVGILIGGLILTVVLSGLSRDHVVLILLIAMYVPFMAVVHGRAHAILVDRINSSALLAEREAEAAESRDFLNALVTHAPGAILVCGPDSRVLSSNPAFERMTGFETHRVLGQLLRDLMSPAGGESDFSQFFDSIEEGRTVEAELPVKKRTGEPIWLRLAGTVAGGNTILMANDVTEQVEAQEARERARIAAEEVARAKSSFLASMSHEIRTPMNGVLGMIELLLDTDLTEGQRDSMRVVRSSAEGLLTILNDILDVSKIEAGQLDLEEIDFELHTLLTGAATVFAVQAEARGTELMVEVGPEVPPHVRGDPTRLRQVVNNLLSNAVKFTEGGEIVLSTQAIAGGDSVALRFSVRDTGIGIPEDKQQKVFGEFEQADQSTTRVHGGTGLGLTISRRLVEMMGGTLEVDSEPGVGSDFHFTLRLPVSRDQAAFERREIAISFAGRRFLIVDDNETARRITREVLRGEGAETDEAENVDLGVAKLRGSIGGAEFDAVILDHLMPFRDGFDFAREVMQDPETRKARILMLTSSASTAGRNSAREVAIGGYLAKPVGRAELLRALTSLLGHVPPETGERRLITRETLKRSTVRARILLAEDNVVNQQVAMGLLKKRGCSVHLAENGQEAVEAVRAGHFDLVLMDIQMPIMDGLEATRQIRQNVANDRMPIVALTAHAFQEERERTVEAGMDDFLSKPFKPSDLFALIDKWVPLRAAPVDSPSSVEEVVDDREVRDTPPVDVAGFRAMMAEVGVEEVVDATLAVYSTEAPEIMARLTAAFASGDSEEIRAAAHSLKSSSGNIRAAGLAEILQDLEGLAGAGDMEAAQRLNPRVRAEYDAVMAHLGSLGFGG